MIKLLKETIEAHGGLENWKNHKSVTTKINAGGVIWTSRNQPGIFDDVNVELNLHKQTSTFYPFGNEKDCATYTPDSIALKKSNGELVEEFLNPKDSFLNFTRESSWMPMQAAYFFGYALWNYINTPYIFSTEGFEVVEIEPWSEHGEVWRRIRVNFPEHIKAHTRSQVFYIDDNGFIRKQDYQVDINGTPVMPVTHYVSDYVTVGGFKFPTKRRIYLRNDDNTARLDGPLIVSIDYRNFEIA